MLCINPASTDPFFNLAVDEYLLKHRSEEFMVLYIDRPSVIIGKHQVANREAETSFVTENNIPVIRRISGGGAVYHDEGNLNFSFILQSSHGSQVDFRKYTAPVIEFLAFLGIDAKFEGKNDLRVNGLKISGNAEHVFRQRVLHHGTLLFDSDIGTLGRSLRKDTSSYSTRAVNSNSSSVTNLSEYLRGMSIKEFRTGMLGFFLRKGNTLMQLDPRECQAIEELASARYRTWEWNYGYGPEYRFEKVATLAGQTCHIKFRVKDGIIGECMIDGSEMMARLAVKLTGHRHLPDEIDGVFRSEGLELARSDIYRLF